MGRILQRNRGFNVGHTKSEIFIRLSSRDVEQARRKMSVRLKDKM